MAAFHVYEEVPEARARGRRIRSKWLDGLRHNKNGVPFVRSRLVAMDFNLFERDDVAAGTPYLFFLRLVVSLAASKPPRGKRQVALYDASVAFFHAELDEWLCVIPPPGLRRLGFLWQLLKALYGTRPASRLWQAYIGEMFEKAQPPWTR
eukprot:2116020-Lingulodinium_polyedra.AAC.1